MFGSPVRQDMSSSVLSPALHRGPMFFNRDIDKENKVGDSLPGSPMAPAAERGSTGADMLRAKNTVLQEQARLKRFKMLLDQVEREVVSKPVVPVGLAAKNMAPPAIQLLPFPQ